MMVPPVLCVGQGTTVHGRARHRRIEVVGFIDLTISLIELRGVGSDPLFVRL